MFITQILSKNIRCNTVCGVASIYMYFNYTCIEKEIWKEAHQKEKLFLGSGIKNDLNFLPHTSLLSKCSMSNILPFKSEKQKVLFFKILVFWLSHLDIYANI